nr:hypothetical protein [Tanacetum cinerariifolium]
EPASPVRDVSRGEACPTESGFIADQDRATIAKSSTLPHDSVPRVTSPAVNEGKEIARVLTSMDAATVLAGGIDVPTGTGSIPTAGPLLLSFPLAVNQGEACPTDSGFIADQDRATIAKSSTLPRDSAPRVTSPAAEEGSMQQTLNELTAFCTSLQRQHLELLAKFQAQEVKINRLKERVNILEDKEGVIGDISGDDAPIKGRSTNEGEAPAERISTDSEEIARVLTSMDAATVLAGETNVPTGSGSIPTAGPPATIVSTGSKVDPTASPIIRRRKGKEILVESDTPKKKKLQEQIDAQMARELEEQQEKEDLRMNEQIARDAEVARIHAEEEIQ